MKGEGSDSRWVRVGWNRPGKVWGFGAGRRFFSRNSVIPRKMFIIPPREIPQFVGKWSDEHHGAWRLLSLMGITEDLGEYSA